MVVILAWFTLIGVMAYFVTPYALFLLLLTSCTNTPKRLENNDD